MNGVIAAGAVFLCVTTGRCMLGLRRPVGNKMPTWGMWGGKIEYGESIKEGLYREIDEEVGFVPDIIKIYPIDVYESKEKDFRYYSFVALVEEEFLPELNNEHVGYCWTKIGQWPRPLHHGALVTFYDKKSAQKLERILSRY